MIPYKQILSHGCLAASFLMILGKSNEKAEKEIILKGSARSYQFYVVGVPMEVSNKYKKDINIIVDNKYFARVLSKAFSKRFTVKAQTINTQLIRELLTQPLICHLDNFYLGDYSHVSHFVVIEKAVKKLISFSKYILSSNNVSIFI